MNMQTVSGPIVKHIAESLCRAEVARKIDAVVADTPAMSLDEACAFVSSATKSAGITREEIYGVMKEYRRKKYASSD